MSTIKLTPTSYLVLGCLAVAGPATPYELKQMVAAGIGYFWSFRTPSFTASRPA